MSLAIRFLSKFGWYFLLLSMSACATTERGYDGYSPIVKVFKEDFEKVWRASQIALKNYPMAVNDIDKGLLETGWIKGYDLYRPPLTNAKQQSGSRYKIFLRTIKGRANGEQAIKVTIQKKLEKQRDFFAEMESPKSDGFEEKSLLYRIDREIEVDNALQMAQEKINESN